MTRTENPAPAATTVVEVVDPEGNAIELGLMTAVAFAQLDDYETVRDLR